MGSYLIDYLIIKFSKQFDKKYYLFHNPDVRHADIDPLWHFVKSGWKEDRNPSETFDIKSYLENIPDGYDGKQNPLVFYIRNTQRKDRDRKPRARTGAKIATQSNFTKAKNYYQNYGFKAFVRKVGRKLFSARDDQVYLAYKMPHPIAPDEVNTDPYRQSFDYSLSRAYGERNKYYEDPISATEAGATEPKEVKLIAFYLPQFHPFPENDKWWGKGFTEWTNVSKATPQFVGHYQPRYPGPLGYYDLRIPEVQEEQVKIAKDYGLFGFCFHYYWFSGRRLLELPLNNYINNPNINFPYCICWANENWTRRWDGLESDILIGQEHVFENDHRFIHDVVEMFHDERYIRYDDRPLLIVYRPTLMEDAERTFDYWRNFVVKQGLKNPFIVSARTFGFEQPELLGMDASVEFPPHNNSYRPITETVQLLNPQYKGQVYDYRDMVKNHIALTKNEKPRFSTVSPSWDNEARKPGRGDSFIHSDPKIYQRWLEQVSFNSMISSKENERFVFINAWNEWAEGAHLEPDREYGYAYLQATRRALENVRQNKFLLKDGSQVVNVEKNHETAVVVHVHYPEMFAEILSMLANIEDGFDLYVTTSLTDSNVLEDIFEAAPSARILPLINKGRDIGSFIEVFRMIYHLDYRHLLKVHTKKSPHRIDGDLWRDDMLSKLISKESVLEAQRILGKKNDIAIIGPQGHIVSHKFYWGSNRENTYKLAKELGIRNPEDKAFSFVAGSMFWVRPGAFEFLLRLPLNIHDFEEEPLPPDGALAHALERLICLAVTLNGNKVVGISKDGKIDLGSKSRTYEFADVTE